MNVLFICTGNINRSAAADILAKANGFMSCASAGTSESARNKNKLAKRTRTPLEKHGVDSNLLNDHRSTFVGDREMSRYDLIIGFQPSHRKWAENAGVARKYKNILELAPHPDWSKRIRVPDPGFDASLAEPIVDYLAEAMPRIVRSLR